MSYQRNHRAPTSTHPSLAARGEARTSTRAEGPTRSRAEAMGAAGGNLAVQAARGESGRREGPEGGGTATGGNKAYIRFPTAERMRGLAVILGWAIAAWDKTKADVTPTQRRERGFWIRWNKTTDAFSKTDDITSPFKANNQDVAVDLGTRPADVGDVYTVASFHTHTPTVHRAPADMKDGARFGGPSQSDYEYDDKDDVAGLVFDYAAPIVPAGHPLGAHAVVYTAGKQRLLP